MSHDQHIKERKEKIEMTSMKHKMYKEDQRKLSEKLNNFVLDTSQENLKLM